MRAKAKARAGRSRVKSGDNRLIMTCFVLPGATARLDVNLLVMYSSKFYCRQNFGKEAIDQVTRPKLPTERVKRAIDLRIYLRVLFFFFFMNLVIYC